MWRHLLAPSENLFLMKMVNRNDLWIQPPEILAHWSETLIICNESLLSCELNSFATWWLHRPIKAISMFPNREDPWSGRKHSEPSSLRLVFVEYRYVPRHFSSALLSEEKSHVFEHLSSLLTLIVKTFWTNLLPNFAGLSSWNVWWSMKKLEKRYVQVKSKKKHPQISQDTLSFNECVLRYVCGRV